MSDEQQQMIRKTMKQYLSKMVRINPATAVSFWSEATEEKLVHLPTEIEDEASWGAILLGWKISDMADEAALEESEQMGSPEHRREVQRAVCSALIEVYRGVLLVPSLNLKKAIPIQIGAKLMKLATNPRFPVECTIEALRSIRTYCTCPDLSNALLAALKECEISGETDHLPYFLDNQVLWTSSLGYGLYISRESPPDASDRYGDQLVGMREFQIKTMMRQDEF